MLAQAGATGKRLPHRHPREGGDPFRLMCEWVPAFAGMTILVALALALVGYTYAASPNDSRS